MLKSFPIFKRNGAHLVEKRLFEKNKDYPFSRFECFEHAKIFLFVLNFDHVNFVMNGKYYRNNYYDNPNYYTSLHNLSNIQKCNFKECPLTWVAPLTVNFFTHWYPSKYPLYPMLILW
jgi:hypothetical protein